MRKELKSVSGQISFRSIIQNKEYSYILKTNPGKTIKIELLQLNPTCSVKCTKFIMCYKEIRNTSA